MYIYIFLTENLNTVMCHLGNPPVFVHEGGGPAVRTLSHCIVVGNRDTFFFLRANYIEIRPPSTPKGMCECVRVFPPGLLFLLGKKA